MSNKGLNQDLFSGLSKKITTPYLVLFICYTLWLTNAQRYTETYQDSYDKDPYEDQDGYTNQVNDGYYDDQDDDGYASDNNDNGYYDEHGEYQNRRSENRSRLPPLQGRFLTLAYEGRGYPYGGYYGEG